METTELLPDLLVYVLESSTILTIFYLFYHALLSRGATFRFNRYYLLLAPIAAAILPTLSLSTNTLLKITQTNIEYGMLLPKVEIYQAMTKTFTPPHIMTWIGIPVYAVGLVIAIYCFVQQVYALKKLEKGSEKHSWKGYKVVFTYGKYPTFSFLKTIYYNDEPFQSEEEKSIILLHESIHIRENHSVDIILLQLACAVFWFNPLFRMFLNAARLNHEYIVDAEVLATAGVSRSAYQKSLVTSVLYSPYLSIGTFFNKSQTLIRIKMMNQTPKSIKLIKIITLALITSCVIFVFSCEINEGNTNYIESLSEVGSSGAGFPDSEPKTPEEIFTAVEEQPNFHGQGNAAFLEYISKNLRYPEELIQNNIEGNVYVEFVVEKDGTITNVQVLKGIDPAADKEAARVIQSSPQWSPGKQNGTPVRVKMVIPIQFSLA